MKKIGNEKMDKLQQALRMEEKAPWTMIIMVEAMKRGKQCRKAEACPLT